MLRLLRVLAAAAAVLLFVVPAQTQPLQPVQVDGCYFVTTPPTLNNNQATAWQCDQFGSGRMTSYGVGQSVAATITRPANTTTYTANTAWANATSGATFTTFTGICRAADREVLIPQIDITTSANPTTKLQGILWLFRAPPTAINDNATFATAAGDTANIVGSAGGFPFTLVNNQAASAVFSGISLTGTTYQVRCNAGTNALYAMVQVSNAYVPTSGEILTIRISTIAVN